MLPVGDGPSNIPTTPSLAIPSSAKNLQMAHSGELKLGFVVRGLAEIITEARTATRGLDTKAFFAGENAGLQQPGGPSLPFKSPTKLGYECFSYFLFLQSL